jgi:ABC-type phosphate transport system auxiliary subunit
MSSPTISGSTRTGWTSSDTPEFLRNAEASWLVSQDMNTNTLSEIHAEIERLSEERSELWHRLSAEYDPELKEDIRRLDAELNRLWDEHRALRARLRFGDRDSIVARARVEERLERAA